MKRPTGKSIIVDDDGEMVGTVGALVRGAAQALVAIANDEVAVDRLLANEELCARLFSAIDAAEQYVGHGRA